jgi:hypothetical protein
MCCSNAEVFGSLVRHTNAAGLDLRWMLGRNPSGMFRLKPIADKSALIGCFDGGELASGEAGAR